MKRSLLIMTTLTLIITASFLSCTAEKPQIEAKSEITTYYFTKIVDYTFDEAIEKVTATLKEQGFGVVSDIDMKAKLHAKLDVDMYNYRILGACHPPSAFNAIELEDKIGLMLPCNVIVQERTPGVVEVSAIDPAAAMSMIDNDGLETIAAEVGEKLRLAIEAL